jgi:hypothetical protein
MKKNGKSNKKFKQNMTTRRNSRERGRRRRSEK